MPTTALRRTQLKTLQSLVWPLQYSTRTKSCQNFENLNCAKIYTPVKFGIFIHTIICSTNCLMIWSPEYLIIWREVFGELLVECKLTIKRGSWCKTDTDCTWSFYPMPYQKALTTMRVIEWKVTGGKDPLNGFHCKMMTAQAAENISTFWTKNSKKLVA